MLPFGVTIPATAPQGSEIPERLMNYPVYCLNVEYSLFLSDINENRIFFDLFSKNTEISSLMEIRPVGAELFHADGRTDMTKLIVTFRNFSKSAKKRTPHFPHRIYLL